MPAAPLAGVEASADIARGLKAHSGWCSSPRADRLAPERIPPRRVGEVLRLQRDLVRKQEANYPARWYEPELEHQVETAWCSAIMERAARTEDCLVYVFGTTTRDFFTEQIALLYGRSCHTFAFDPTITAKRFTTHFPDRVTFKPWGLRSGGVETRWKHPVYGRLLGELLTLQAIKARLGHSGRRLALMKVDCEGCEWAWLGRSQPDDELFLVDQLFMEFHFASTLRFDDDALRLAPTVRETLQTHFRVALSWPSYGFDGDQNKSHPQLTAAGVDPQPCCRPFLFLRKGLAHAMHPEPSGAAMALHGAYTAWSRAGQDRKPRNMSVAQFWRAHTWMHHRSHSKQSPCVDAGVKTQNSAILYMH